MRTVFALALGLMVFAAVDRAQAREYPWCAQYTGGWGDSSNCGFDTLDQCVVTVRGVGGLCHLNPLYPASVRTAPVPLRKHKHKRAQR